MPKDDAPRRRPIRTDTVNMTGEYEGTWAKVRTNPPFRVFDLFGENTRLALAQVLIEWNLVDDDGAAVPLETEGDKPLSGATDEELSALARGYLEALRVNSTVPKES